MIIIQKLNNIINDLTLIRDEIQKLINKTYDDNISISSSSSSASSSNNEVEIDDYNEQIYNLVFNNNEALPK